MLELIKEIISLNFLYFIFSIFLAIYIPGNVLLSSQKNTNIIIKLTLSLALGISLWAIQGYIFGFLNLRGFTYLYLLVFAAIWLLQNKNLLNKITRPNFILTRVDKLLIITLLTGIIYQLSSVIFNAIGIGNSVYFCCGGEDVLFHTALTKELITNFPPNEPAFANIALKNYHFLSNLVIADLIRIFHLPLISVQFYFIPIFMSIMLGLSALSLATILNLGKKFTLIFLCFTFFFSDNIYLLTLISTSKLNFSLSTIETAYSLWISFSRYFGIIIFLNATSFLILYLKNKKISFYFPLIAMGASLIGFKVYIGLIFLSGCGVVFLYSLMKKDLKTITVLIVCAIISFLIYFPINKNAGGLIYVGFWRFEDFIVQPELTLSNMELARRIYLEAGNILKTITYDLAFMFIYIIFSLGGLCIAFLNSFKNYKKLDVRLNIFLITSFIISSILGLFFIQKTGGPNSSQFLISSYLILSIYASLLLSNLNKNTNLFIKIIVVLLFLSIFPKSIYLFINQFNKVNTKQGITLNSDYKNALIFIDENINNKSIFIIDSNLSHLCLFLPIYTIHKPYSCIHGSPADRGIGINEIEKASRTLLMSGSKTSVFDYAIIPSNLYNLENTKIIYENNSLKILKKIQF